MVPASQARCSASHGLPATWSVRITVATGFGMPGTSIQVLTGISERGRIDDRQVARSPRVAGVSCCRLRNGGTIHANEATRKGGLRRDRGMDSPGLTSKVEVERADDDACMMRH